MTIQKHTLPNASPQSADAAAFPCDPRRHSPCLQPFALLDNNKSEYSFQIFNKTVRNLYFCYKQLFAIDPEAHSGNSTRINAVNSTLIYI
jgi:hypothetical protein